MIFNVQHTANWEYIHAHKKGLIQKNNKKENKSCIPLTYHINDKVMLRKGTKNKCEAPFRGPHTIFQVNMNGTVHLCVGSITDTMKIHHLQAPFFGKSAICEFHRRREELMTELMNQTRLPTE
jgi:hypothetical protein